MILEEIKKDFPLLENRDIAYLEQWSNHTKTKTSNRSNRKIL